MNQRQARRIANKRDVWPTTRLGMFHSGSISSGYIAHRRRKRSNYQSNVQILFDFYVYMYIHTYIYVYIIYMISYMYISYHKNVMQLCSYNMYTIQHIPYYLWLCLNMQEITVFGRHSPPTRRDPLNDFPCRINRKPIVNPQETCRNTQEIHRKSIGKWEHHRKMKGYRLVTEHN